MINLYAITRFGGTNSMRALVRCNSVYDGLLFESELIQGKLNRGNTGTAFYGVISYNIWQISFCN